LFPSRNVLKFQSITLALADIEAGAALIALFIWPSARAFPAINIPPKIKINGMRYMASS
jgi:hypothetical protein